MIRQARTRSTQSEVSCQVKALIVSDATDLKEIQSNSFDVVSASFLFCVLPNELQVQVQIIQSHPYHNHKCACVTILLTLLVTHLNNVVDLQRKAIDEIHRVLRPGGKFRIIELMYSKDPKKRWYQGDCDKPSPNLN